MKSKSTKPTPLSATNQTENQPMRLGTKSANVPMSYTSSEGLERYEKKGNRLEGSVLTS